MGEITLDEEVFISRLQQLYQSWNEGEDVWGTEDSSCTAVCIPAGASTGEELRYLKSASMQLWLFGYELPDTVLVFTKEKFHVLSNGKKATLIGTLAGACEKRAGIELVIHNRPKGEDGSPQIKEVLDAIKASGEPPVLGLLLKEKQEGKLGELWSSMLQEAEVKQVDVAAAFSQLLASKGPQDITKAKKAAFLAASAMKNFAVPELEKIIDEEKKVKHAKFGQKIEEVILEPLKMSVKLKAEAVDISYPSIVQSGGVYDLKASAVNDERPLQYDVVLIAIGARYSLFCANVARTYLVDPNAKQQEEYAALMAAMEAAVKAIVPGSPLCDAYAAAVKAIEEKGQRHLVAKLPKNLGWSVGTEMRESLYQITAKNTATVKPNMLFNVSIGVTDLERTDAGPGQASNYALLVADTFLVHGEEGKAAECLTAHAPKAWSDVAYNLKEDEEEEMEPTPRAPRQKEMFPANKNLRSQGNRDQGDDRMKQKENQEVLLKVANENTMKMLKSGGGESGGAVVGRKVSSVEAYKSVEEIPTSRDLAIQVDQKNECVLVPIYGIMVPFHILTVKNATNNQDGDHAYIRLNFNFGAAFEPGAKHPRAIFLKELSYRTSDTRHAAKVVQEIKVLRSGVSQRERERAERATLVEQERLIKAKGRLYTLPDLWIRPNFGGKGRKMTGQLEAHANGFRYSNPKGEMLDIMYRNIKHAVCQEAKNEMITLLHFNLHNPIMVGKKKTSDVTFFTEVMESVQTIDAGRRSMYDPDELEEEQREREVRNKINARFDKFSKTVQKEIFDRDFGDLGLEFEIPFRDLGFSGVPHRTTCFVMPTVNSLVELIETPPTVITLSEVNIINLERVGFGLRNFDMAIVFKDLTKDVMRIDAIPMENLDTIREWLHGMSIKYYESKMNLNWKPILKSIIEDPDGFIATGGWDFLNAEGSSDDDEDNDSEEEDEFKPDSEEEEEAESDEDDDDGSDFDEDEEDDEEEDYSEEEDEEEGKSWDELEKEAMRDDRKRAAEGGESDDDNRGKTKKKARR